MSTPVISGDGIFSHIFIGAADLQKSVAFYAARSGCSWHQNLGPFNNGWVLSVAKMNRPHSPEALWCESCRLGRLDKLPIVDRFGFRGRYVPDGRQQSSMVEPVHPFQRCQFHRLAALP